MAAGRLDDSREGWARDAVPFAEHDHVAAVKAQVAAQLSVSFRLLGLLLHPLLELLPR